MLQIIAMLQICTMFTIINVAKGYIKYKDKPYSMWMFWLQNTFVAFLFFIVIKLWPSV